MKLDVAEFLARGEGRTLEFKRDLSSPKNILKELVAFSNTAGGTLLIGVEDDGTVRGLGNIRGEEEQLANLIADGITPKILPDIERATYEGRDLLVVQVPRFPGPCYLTVEGEERGVYVRLGTTSRRASAEQREALTQAARQVRFDQRPCIGTALDDLDREAATAAFQQVGRELTPEAMESLGMLVRFDGERLPSNGGILLFGKSAIRRTYFLEAGIQCARFAGTEKMAAWYDRGRHEGGREPDPESRHRPRPSRATAYGTVGLGLSTHPRSL